MKGGDPVRTVVPQQLLLRDDQKFECVEKFCYLGDVIGAGGGADEAARARVRSACVKFWELAPVLALRGASLKVKGKVYRVCVQRTTVYGSETWPMKVEDMQRLERTERLIVRWTCGVSLKNRMSSEDLNRRLGVVGVAEIVRRGCLRCFGHLERKDRNDWVSACRDFDVPEPTSKGIGRKPG